MHAVQDDFQKLIKKGSLMKNEKKLLLGAHMSIAGGLSNALFEGASIGCTAIQFFLKNNRQWFFKEPSNQEIQHFIENQKKTGITSIIAHASYLINLGSPNAELFSKSIIAATNELSLCEKMKIPYLVLHPGSFTSSSPKEAFVAISKGIDEILSYVSGKSMLLLETMAGQGTTVGRNFSELAAIRNLIKNKKRVGICLDTCHVFASGYCLNTKASYENLWKEFDESIGLKNLKVIHLNDSLKQCGSFTDRHAEIGKGEMGLSSFTFIMNDERFFNIPKMLETPKKTLQDDLKNMLILKNMLSEKNKNLLNI